MSGYLRTLILSGLLVASLATPSADAAPSPAPPTVPAPSVSSPLVADGCTVEGRLTRVLPALLPCGIHVGSDGDASLVAVPPRIGAASSDTGAGWSRAEHPGPARRVNAALAYLPSAKGVVMYGGLVCPGWVCNPVAETWLWNGEAWRRLRPATSPPPLHAPAMTYDPARNELVLFGGETCTPADCVFSSETWTFDGTNWEKQNPSVSPIASAASAVAFDPKSSRVLISGGCAQDRCPGLVGTWSWDGTTWKLEDLLTPLPRAGAQMATNPGGGVVLFGGQEATGSTSAETWVWDGGWTRRTPGTSPPSRAYGAATHDSRRNEVLLHAGSSVTCSPGCSGGYVKDLWAWDGQTWRQRSMNDIRVGQSHAIAYDAERDQVVRFGGISTFANHIGANTAAYETSTWLWDGESWTERRSPNPEERNGAALGFHPDAGLLVLTGGYCAYAVTCDTWTWDGSRWTNIGVPAPRPNSRNSLAPTDDGSLLFPTAEAVWKLSYDAAQRTWSWTKLEDTAAPAPGGWTTAHDRRGEIVLFGAQLCCPSAYWDRTWSLRSGKWLERSPATRPPARAFAAMTLDEDSGDTVMFGGLAAGGQTYFGDMWMWDGETWRAGPASGPPSRAFFRTAWDPSTDEVMVYGGLGGGTDHPPLRDQWMFDGSTWREVASPAPGVRLEHSLAAFGPAGTTVLYGGQDANPGRPMNETWSWTAPSTG